ncbi:MAG: hypothetical protein NTU51_04650 [Bacteroidetes bacterium]|nr:hypothetical protein [Bacteroidota bacterium]
MKETWVLGINITDRVSKVALVQNVLAKFGCSVRTRLGLHNPDPGACPGCGLILLELYGDIQEFIKLENELLKIEGIEVKKMVFKQG